jgi:hypothetical protein
MASSNVPPPAVPSKPVSPTSHQSQALVADARQRMAARKARSAQTLADHKQARILHKAHSRNLVEAACEEATERLERSRRARHRLEQWSPDSHRRPY